MIHPTVQIHLGDCRDLLRSLPESSVQCCVTSPPYWGLRDYGTATWSGGDVEGCDHQVGTLDRKRGDRQRFSGHDKRPDAICQKCGAERIDSQIGLEPTIEAFVTTMVEVFAEVRRVLRPDGVCWVNLGDSYNNSGLSGGSKVYEEKGQLSFRGKQASGRIQATGLKPKELCGIPWRVALALQADGWWLRQDVIWHKPNPMPESVRDRCTKAHEYLFQLTKSETYYWDEEATKEPASPDTHARYARGRSDTHKYADGGPGKQTIAKSFEHMKRKAGVNPKAAPAGSGIKNNESFSNAVKDVVESRNWRSVWTIPTEPCKDAHFATFPSALPRRCILASTRPGDVVLDPFGGSGTTGQVALELGRSAILLELNPEYAAIARRRTTTTAGLAL